MANINKTNKINKQDKKAILYISILYSLILVTTFVIILQIYNCYACNEDNTNPTVQAQTQTQTTETTQTQTQTTTATTQTTITPEEQLATIMQAAETWLDSEEIELMTNCLYGEARGLDDTQKSAVVWCILNRYDAGYGTIEEIITAENQFTGYKRGRIFSDSVAYQSCKELVIDVYCRWYAEKLEVTNVGRTLPQDYLWFYGNGKVNVFRNQYSKAECDYWDWSSESPY